MIDMIFVDQSQDKQYCIDLLDQLEADKNNARYQEACQSTLDKVMDRAEGWNIDKRKLRALLRSQIWSGNVRGAIKVINSAIPDRRTRKWVPVAGIILLATAYWYMETQIR